MSIDRRRSARVELVGQVHGHAMSLDVPVTVRELSLGGMAIETPFSFPVGAVHQFKLMLGDGAHVLLNGQARHCRALTTPNASSKFVTGFEFVDEAHDGSQTVGELMNKIR
jgi:PilZ domain-containing protein